MIRIGLRKGVTILTNSFTWSFFKRSLNSNSGRLEGKIALVTGAASGIGKATATKFIENGAKVVIADIQKELGLEAAEQLGPNATFVPCDVTRESDVSDAVDFTVSLHKKLDIMYNNAGVACNTPPSILDLDLAVFDKVMNINVRGVLAGIKHASRVMIPRRSGSIVCTASITGLMGGLAQHTYTVSKFAVIGIVKSLASELSKYGIRVNCISPFAIPTPFVMEEMSRLFPGIIEQKLEQMIFKMGVLEGTVCETNDIANAALYVASDDAKYVSGLNLVVDGGFTCFKSFSFPVPDQNSRNQEYIEGIEMQFRYEMKSRSYRTVEEKSFMIDDALKQSCWANMPPELLRDVLMRIEATDDTWPHRKNVVACAGVCRSWRAIMREIVQIPEISGKLTFPISLKQPGLRSSIVQCYIRRNRRSQTYLLYLSLNQATTNDGKFLLAARKCRRPTCTDYIICLNSDDVSKRSNTYIGKLRANFLGTKFTVYDVQHPTPNAGMRISKCYSTRLMNVKQVSSSGPPGNYPVAHIAYELNVLGSRGPRRMQCVMDAIPASSIEPGGVCPMQTEFQILPGYVNGSSSFSIFRSKSTRVESFEPRIVLDPDEGKLILRNKAPRWHEQLQCWSLNFNGRVTVASVKNFQLVASVDNMTPGQGHDDVILQFGKVGKDVFTMDYRYPLSAFQAFAICLSSFDTKIACE